MYGTYPSSNSLSVPREFNFISSREFSFFIDEVHLATKTLETERKRCFLANGSVEGGLINLKTPDNTIIISDLHGDLDSLFRILMEVKFRQFLSNPNNKMIFLGDYIDRGSDSIGILHTICHLKRKYPDSVVLMSGNHEAIEKFHFLAHDLPKELDSRYGLRGKLAYEQLLLLFRLLTKAVVIENQLLLVHGGVPVSIGKNSFFDAIRQEDYDILEELLWNDPRSDMPNNQDWCDSRRGFGKHFGKNITKKCLDLTKTKALVRGHEPCHGFRLDHNGMVLTLFSSKEAYQKFDAAYLAITKEELTTIQNASDLSKYVKKI
ncbi:MAG: serine/threonine protein phosphatase [Thaumarchaeota archaeon]|nr:serine/threonine protein phosphatase [Nitrososphaerota archaeon]